MHKHWCKTHVINSVNSLSVRVVVIVPKGNEVYRGYSTWDGKLCPHLQYAPLHLYIAHVHIIRGEGFLPTKLLVQYDSMMHVL